MLISKKNKSSKTTKSKIKNNHNSIQETGSEVNQFIYYAIDNQWQVNACTVLGLH